MLLPLQGQLSSMSLKLSSVLLLWLTAAWVSRPVVAESGNHQPMIEAKHGWQALEIVTEGDNPSGNWAIADEMDGMGAFLVQVNEGDAAADAGAAMLRIHVNHEDEDEGTISEVNLHKGRLQQAIRDVVVGNDKDTTNVADTNEFATTATTTTTTSYNFVESARAAYDRWTPDGGVSWNSVASATKPSEAGRFCRFCSSQYFESEAFGPHRGFVDPIYITGEECDNGRLFALDVAHNNNNPLRDLYQVSGVTGAMPMAMPMAMPPLGGAGETMGVLQKAWETTIDIEFEAGTGGMPLDSWENAAAIDTNETDHIALLLSADGGSRRLRLYIGKKFTNAQGKVDRFQFLARNGLAYGRYYYLGDNFEWTETENEHQPEHHQSGKLWESTTPGRFVTNQDDGWYGRRFEDIDTNPNNPKQIVLAESTSGVYILDFELAFRFDAAQNEYEFNVMESSFRVAMITNDDYEAYENPDNVDWTANNLIFVNKDSDEGGVWYMNPDGSGKVQIGHTRSGGESTGILDVSKHLDYPPSSVMITTNQGYPSSMTLLLNPSLKAFLLPVSDSNIETPVPATVGSDSSIAPPPSLPTLTPMIPVPSPTLKPTATPPVEPIVVTFDPVKECPASNYLSHVYQAEDAILVSADVKSRNNYFCGTGYVDFREEKSRISDSRNVGGRGQGSNTNTNDNNDNNGGDDNESSTKDLLGISFTVMIDLPGTHRVSVRYANGGAATVKRSGILLVDEKDTGPDFEFASTFGWDRWVVEKRLVIFDTVGWHTLDLFWTKENKRPNIDWLSIEFVG